jgi:class 3 adenylate cyclase
VKVARPLFYKVAGATVGVVVVVLAFSGVISYRQQRSALEDKFGLTLQHVAQTTALFIDGDDHERIHGNADASSEAFTKLRAAFEAVRKENGLAEDQIYSMRPISEDELEFVVMLQHKTFIGDHYRPPGQTRELVRWVLKDGRPRYTPIYRDAHGAFISGLAPIRARDGRIVALLEVDYRVEQYVAELRASLWRQAWIPVAAMALALFLSLWVASSISRAARKLVAGTQAVQAGRYDQLVMIETRDELRAIGDAFNEMLVGLRERFAMLKFVPRHTREVIADAIRDDISGRALVAGVAQMRDVAMLFSDIRGFTALSDRLSPNKIIQMLNVYLRKEAEIIERYGGSIDKYIGDAVMAIFEGEDRFERAVQSAVEIQRTLAELNAQAAFDEPVLVGIGIAGGEVVMGSVGYEDRLEFAVIGRMVNLAARLCSVAKGGEIVISELAWDKVKDRYRSEALTGLKLKGFAADVTCYKMQTAA